MRHGELLQGDFHIIHGIAGNAVWEKWQIGLPLPTFSYDFSTQNGQFCWQLNDRTAEKLRHQRGKNKEFSFLHDFTNDTGLIATYRYVSKSKQITLDFWIVSPSTKELMFR